MQYNIEPMRVLHSIRLIYGDGIISDELLHNLGLMEGYIIHRYYYHIHDENWPLERNFGNVVFELIKSYLGKILLACTKTE